MMRKFLSGSASAAAAGVFSRGVGLLTLPVLVRYLDKEQYGAYDYFLSVGMLLAVLVSLEIGQSITRFAGREADPGYRSTVAATVLWFLLAVLAVFAALAAHWAEAIAQFLFDDVSMAGTVFPFALFLAASVLNNYVSRMLRADQRFGWAALHVAATSLLTAFVLVYGVVFLEFGVAEMLYASAAVSVPLFAVFYLCFLRSLIGRMSLQVLRRLLAFSAPLVFSSSAIVASLFSDRFFIAEFMGLDAVAEYAVAARLAFVVSVVTTAFQVTVNPLVYAAAGDANALRPLQRIFLLYFGLTLAFLACAWFLSAPAVRIIAGEGYVGAAIIVPVLGLSVLMQSAYIFFPGLLVAGKTGVFASINVAAALINICLNIVFIQSMGVVGAALATLLSSLGAFLCIGLYSLYVTRFPGSAFWFFMYAFVAAVIVFLGLGASSGPGSVQMLGAVNG